MERNEGQTTAAANILIAAFNSSACEVDRREHLANLMKVLGQRLNSLARRLRLTFHLSHPVTEELVRDCESKTAFSKSIEKLHFESVGKFMTYANTVIINSLRDRKKELDRLTLNFDELESAAVANAWASAKQLQEQIDACLDVHLVFEEMEKDGYCDEVKVLRMKYWSSGSNRELAAELGFSESCFQQRLAKAMLRFTRYYKGDQFPNGF